jgi:hypothetical protein
VAILAGTNLGFRHLMITFLVKLIARLFTAIDEEVVLTRKVRSWSLAYRRHLSDEPVDAKAIDRQLPRDRMNSNPIVISI